MKGMSRERQTDRERGEVREAQVKKMGAGLFNSIGNYTTGGTIMTASL